jgi:nucleotide-binding universal stress UspA family protein
LIVAEKSGFQTAGDEEREDSSSLAVPLDNNSSPIGGKMKILIGIEDSIFSENAARFVAQRPWHSGTQVRLISAVEMDPMSGYVELEKSEIYNQASEVIDRAVAILRGGGAEFEITTKIVEGNPKHVILDEADHWNPDLIVVGSHGRSGLGRFLLGSVSQAIALHAPCSVEIVRAPPAQSA